MDEKAPVVLDVEHLTVYERLKGWHIEIRHRDNYKRHDKYFYHQKSKGKFRSFIEVENYIIQGHFPQKSQQKLKKRKEPLALTLVHESSKEASCKKKKTSQSSKITKKHKKFVEKYLAKAWYNFLNSGKLEEEVHFSTNEEPTAPIGNFIASAC
ncbi:hypothetical protein LOK49_LG05G00483 [Camellia lanceoleosa]|uniref:Uncharacterized protein n=1 Tax=Camellia lanceoleosa TaxID=1840588 RepID=A0ACC0HXB1_9ERIC|nr:hypothetical protein LOK49_LG05G00483 [Camellia lanceoleosa]